MRSIAAASQNSHRVLTDGALVFFFFEPSSGSDYDRCVSTAEACGEREGKEQILANAVITGPQSGAAGPFQQTPGWLWCFDVTDLGAESTHPMLCSCCCNGTVGGKTVSSTHKSSALFLHRTVWLVFMILRAPQLISGCIRVKLSVHLSCDRHQLNPWKSHFHLC